MSNKHRFIYWAIFAALILFAVYSNNKATESDTAAVDHQKKIDSLHLENTKLSKSVDSLNEVSEQLKSKRKAINKNYEKIYTEIDTAGSGDLINHFGRVFSKNNIR